MTPQEWIAMVRRIPQMIRDNRVLFFATTTTMDTMEKRIWGRGELTSGGKLVYKQDYEVYAYKPPSPKAVSGKGKSGKPIKGGYYPTYLDYKASQDRGQLPFELTGELRQAWVGGPTTAPQEKNPLLCVIEMPADIAARAEGLAKQKGEFLAPSDAERQEHLKNLQDAYQELVLDRL